MTISLPTYTGETTSLVMLTGNFLLDALILGSKWGTGPAGTGAVVTFSFPDGLNDFDTRSGIAGNYNALESTQSGFSAYLPAFTPFGATPQEAARHVLASWASVANLQFNEVAPTSIDAGTLRFAFTAPPGLGETTYAVSSWPQDLAMAGDTWFNSAYIFPEGWAPGTQNFLTLLHEVGHAIGLKHPHDTGMGGSPGWPLNASVLPFTGSDTLINYSSENMVMAYNDVPGLGSPVQADFAATTPMRVDIAAVQYLYGANLAFNSGDTVYRYSSSARYNETIWDGGGNDTILVDGDAASFIDLTPGSWSQLGLPLTYSERDLTTLAVTQARPDLTDARTVFIYDSVRIENATGGGGNDQLIGNDAANLLAGGGGSDRLFGGAGDDTMDGGAGIDTVVYSNTRASYTLTSSVSGRSINGIDGADTFSGVERLQFADRKIALDLSPNEHAGQALEFLGVLAPAAANNPAIVGVILNIFDQGSSLRDVCQLAINIGLVGQIAGSTNNIDVAHMAFLNVVGVPASTEMADLLVSFMDGRNANFSQADFLTVIAGMEINQTHIGLIGLQQTGIEFI